MSKNMINCTHCKQRIKVKNSRNGFCFKTRNVLKKINEKLVTVEKVYLDCERYYK